MSKLDIAKFLASAFNMVKRGDIKSEQDLINFAKQQFGELDSGILGQIKDAFTKGKAAAVTETRTKNLIKDDQDKIKELESEEGLSSLMETLQDKVKDLKQTSGKTGMFDNIFDAMIGFRRAEGSKDTAKPFKTPGMPYQKENPNYRLPGGSMYAEGNLRTAMREFLKTEVKEGRLKLDETDLFRITEYSPRSIDDPIDVFRRYYGEQAMEAADAMAKKLEKGTSFKDYENIFRRNMPELKIKVEGAGQYDESIANAEKALIEAKDQADYAKTLDEFDVTDRKKNFRGGILTTRVGLAEGRIKLLKFLYDKGLDLKDEIRKAVNNIMESGDRKVDADVAVDDMFENLGIDRDMVDQKDVLKAYDEAYQTLSVPPGSRGGPEDIAAPFSDDAVDLPEGVKPEDTILPTGNLVSSQLKLMRLAEDIQPGLFENLTDEQKDIILKYGDRIDKDLLKNIVLDTDLNNRAAAIATLEQVDTLASEGKSMDEIMSILQSTPRTKQAKGGLSYLMGM
jgi:hypothetical protein